MKILLTGQAGLESAIYAINQAGLHRYIEKPWEAEDLSLTIDNLLTQYRLQRDLRVYHERLEKRTRELKSLHDVGLALAAATELGAVLTLVADAARGIAGARHALVVGTAGRAGTAWSAAPGVGLEEARRLMEAALARRRAERPPEVPDRLPRDVRAIPLQQGEALFGWVLLDTSPEPSPDTRDLLEILAGQGAARLATLELVDERIESERLSTIGRMLQTIVHDFRNPMTAIKGYSGMVEELDLSRDRQKECAHLIIEEADRMNLMIEELLEFARGGRASLNLTRTTVEDLAAKVRRLMEPEFQGRRVEFRTALEYPGQLLVDVERMKRAILNIASNALDAMRDGGTFTFGSRLHDGGVELVLTDTGHGIPAELQARIFEPFFTHGKARGIGLGMSITRKIVEEHGGEIHLDSEPGKGTTFTVRLPLDPVAERKPPRLAASRASS